VNSEKKFSASFAPTRNTCFGAPKCRSINGNQIHEEFIENTSCGLAQHGCNHFLCYPCKIKKYSELTLLRDCYRHHKGNLTATWKFFWFMMLFLRHFTKRIVFLLQKHEDKDEMQIILYSEDCHRFPSHSCKICAFGTYYTS